MTWAETITTVLIFGACCVGKLAKRPSMHDWLPYVNPQLHLASTTVRYAIHPNGFHHVTAPIKDDEPPTT
jgi:hypothetical protein